MRVVACHIFPALEDMHENAYQIQIQSHVRNFKETSLYPEASFQSVIGGLARRQFCESTHEKLKSEAGRDDSEGAVRSWAGATSPLPTSSDGRTNTGLSHNIYIVLAYRRVIKFGIFVCGSSKVIKNGATG